MLRPPLVIINSEQFGYNPATYYYCKYLRDRYNITYINWDHGLDKVNLQGVKVIYVKRKKGVLRIFKLLKEILKYTVSNNTIIFIKYFKVISVVVRLLRPTNPLVLDIRTGSIEPGRLRRIQEDTLLKLESIFFHKITVISKSLAVRLGIFSRSTILPLGADVISKTEKKFDNLRLLYVGTLYNRNIYKAIEGFAKFFLSTPSAKKTKFTIIGAGLRDEINQLKKLIEQHNLQDVVHILGRIPHDQLQKYFDSSNVGVSYIPMTKYYDVQPATKNFEYLLSGLAVIGTNTSENKLVINELNGILTGDSSDDFCDGLIQLQERMARFNSQLIRNNAQQFSWKNITNNLDAYLKRL